MRAVSAEVIFNGLVVTYVDKYVVENSKMGVLVHRRQHSALSHVLHYADSFEAYGFSSGIWTGNNQDSFLRREVNIERHNLTPL